MHADTPSLELVLRDLLTVLEFEADALRGFDLQAIDTATAAKQELEPVLTQALAEFAPASVPEPEQARLLGLREQVTTLAQLNQRRIRASLTTVASLVRHLTGREEATYGRRSGGNSARPILTSEVG